MTATAIAAYSFVVGIALGMFIPSVFVDSDPNHQISTDTTKAQIFTLGLATAITSSVILIPVFLTFKNDNGHIEPIQEQEESVVNVVVTNKNKSWNDLKMLMGNKSFMLTCLASSFLMGYCGSITTVLEQMIVVYDFTSQQASYMGALYQITGITGGLLCSTYITYASRSNVKMPPYKGVLVLIALLTLLCKCYISLLNTFLAGLLVYYAMMSRISWLLYVAIGFNGFANLSTNSVMYELGVETTFNQVGEATSCGFINLLVNIFQFIFIMILTPILDRRNVEAVFLSMAILLGITLAGVIIAILAPYDYKRTKHQMLTETRSLVL